MIIKFPRPANNWDKATVPYKWWFESADVKHPTERILLPIANNPIGYMNSKRRNFDLIL